jgi:hypothetical protein
LYNDELHDVHSSTNIIMPMKSGECGGRGMWHAWERRENMYKFLVGTPEGKRPLGRPRCRWKNGSKMDLREIVWGWSGFSWLRIGTGGGLLRMQ